jgi:uncharacterized protein
MSSSRARRLHWFVPLLALSGLLATAGAQQAARSPLAPGGDWRSSVRQFAAEHLKHPAWGYSHSVRDYQLAKALAAEDHVAIDDDVLYAAAYLHDVAALPPYEKPHRDHADEGAELVGSLLSGSGFPLAKIEAVRGAIRTHMFDRKPVGPEALYLHDADALDWLGAVGVARIFALVDPNGGSPDGPAALKMLQDNLRRVPAGILSRAGRVHSVARVRELQRYLGELGSETDDFKAL